MKTEKKKLAKGLNNSTLIGYFHKAILDGNTLDIMIYEDEILMRMEPKLRERIQNE